VRTALLLSIALCACKEEVKTVAPDAGPSRGIGSTLAPATVPSLHLHPGPVEVDLDLQEMRSPTPLTVSAKLDVQGSFEYVALGQLRRGDHTYRGQVPAECRGGCRLAGLVFNHPGTDIAGATARLHVAGLSGTDEGGNLAQLEGSFGVPGGWRPGAPTVGGPEVRLRAGKELLVDLQAPGGPYAEVVRGDSPEPLPAVVTREAAGPSAAQGGVPVGETTGMSGTTTRFTVSRVVDYAPRAGDRAVIVDLGLALRLDDDARVGEQQVWLSRSDTGDEQALVRSLRQSGVTVRSRETAAALERVYAGDGAVLALRLLLVCGAAAVVVSVGALLVAAYVGRRQRAYEVAALRAVGLRRRTVRALLLRENVGTVLVALACGALASLLAVWAVLPALPQFDAPSSSIPVRYAPVAAAGWLAVGALAGLLVLVGLTVATLQLRAGRSDRLREGVR